MVSTTINVITQEGCIEWRLDINVLDSKSSLSEDRDLQGFQPLEGSLKEFNFKSEIADSEIEHKVRMRRIIDFARWLCDYDLDGVKLITK